MSIVLPNKSSSRAGRFKKKLVSKEELTVEGPAILAKINPYQNLLSGADFVAVYVITYLAHRFPGNWLGSRRDSKVIPGASWRELQLSFEPNIVKRLEGIQTLNEIFANFALKSTPLTVNRAILEWSAGNYGLELMLRIPGPREVLDQQKYGRRCVTTLVDERITKYILGERDALSFTMHDLIHADHFYYHNASFKGQLGFYGLLDETYGYFDLTHEKFATEFEYLISDMNAYPIHLLKCLKSAMFFYFSQEYFNNWLAPLNAPDALRFLNSKLYRPHMDEEILIWLEKYRKTL